MSKDVKILTGIGVVTLIIVFVAAFTIGNKPSPVKPPQKVLNKEQMKILLRSDMHEVKAKDAKVTVVEFGDYQCSACGLVYPIIKQVKEDYKGKKVTFAFRPMPLTSHPNGYISALAAETAGGQNKFWEMFDKIYANQEEWSEKKDPTEIFVKYAKQIGINVNKFKDDLKKKKYDYRLKRDLADAAKLGVDATPSFFINGEMYTGVISEEDFQTYIDKFLNSK